VRSAECGTRPHTGIPRFFARPPLGSVFRANSVRHNPPTLGNFAFFLSDTTGRTGNAFPNPRCQSSIVNYESVPDEQHTIINMHKQEECIGEGAILEGGDGWPAYLSPGFPPSLLSCGLLSRTMHSFVIFGRGHLKTPKNRGILRVSSSSSGSSAHHA
jgi:hypothetical protein